MQDTRGKVVPPPVRDIAESVLKRFRRKTTTGQYIPVVDGLRFVSIWFVVLFHIDAYINLKTTGTARPLPSANAFHEVLSIGHFGVQLFFVLSGFVLALPFAKHCAGMWKEVSLRAYFIRRVTRLEPPYVIAMLACAVLLAATGRQAIPEILPHLAASLVYLHNIIYRTNSTINTVAWSLEVEVQFYILAPLLAAVFKFTNTIPRRIMLVSAAILAGSLSGVGLAGTVSVLDFLPYFLAGFVLTDLYVFSWKAAPDSHVIYDVVSLLGWPLFVSYLMRGGTNVVVMAAIILVLFVSAFRGRFTRALLSNDYVSTIGGMCYSIYLIHFVVIAMVGKVTLHQKAPLGAIATLYQFAAMAIAVVVTSALFFVVIERPCMDSAWPQHLRTRLAGGIARRATVM